jgi:hypothetical protein
MEWGCSGQRGWCNGDDGYGMEVGETNPRFGPVFVRSAHGHGHGEGRMAKSASKLREQIWPVFTAAGIATIVQDVAVFERRWTPEEAVGTIIF